MVTTRATSAACEGIGSHSITVQDLNALFFFVTKGSDPLMRIMSNTGAHLSSEELCQRFTNDEKQMLQMTLRETIEEFITSVMNLEAQHDIPHDTTGNAQVYRKAHAESLLIAHAFRPNGEWRTSSEEIDAALLFYGDSPSHTLQEKMGSTYHTLYTKAAIAATIVTLAAMGYATTKLDWASITKNATRASYDQLPSRIKTFLSKKPVPAMKTSKWSDTIKTEIKTVGLPLIAAGIMYTLINKTNTHDVKRAFDDVGQNIRTQVVKHYTAAKDKLRRLPHPPKTPAPVNPKKSDLDEMNETAERAQEGFNLQKIVTQGFKKYIAGTLHDD